MDQKDKELLLKDLCARLPYYLKVNINEKIETLNAIGDDCGYYFNFLNDNEEGVTIENIKPYLFPLSSMTEEQKEEFNSYFANVPYYGNNEHEHVVPYYFVELLMEFFHKNHIDNNGLIPMGLAIDATGKNIY